MIQARQTAAASDFITSSAGAGDSDKVAKLGSDGQLDKSFVQKFVKFGGTGADGALTITSGVTNIDLGGAQVVVKNYTSISITGTGSLTFSNPHSNGTIIVIRSQGNVTLTSSATPMINASGCGASGGGTSAHTSSFGGGNEGVDAYGIGAFYCVRGTAATRTGQQSGVGGTSGSIVTNTYANIVKNILSTKYQFLCPGAGSSSGTWYFVNGSGSLTPGAGGRGGGALVIECGGAWNFTTTNGISVAGGNGTDAINGGCNTGSGAEGGTGGGAGCFIGIYNSLTANSGTVNVSAGSGGANVATGIWAGVGGGVGAGMGTSLVAQNTEFA
jgi:hypothetical protein